MSMLFSRKAILPVWLVVVCGVFALLGAPMTSATLCLLLIVGVLPPANVLILSKERSPSVAEIIRDAHASRTE